MPSPEKMNISGPTKRKALQSVRQNSHPEVGDSAADDGPVNSVYEEPPITHSREGSVLPLTSESDDSLSDACTDDMEPLQEHGSSHTQYRVERLRKRKTPSKQLPVQRPTIGDDGAYTDDLEETVEPKRDPTPFEKEVHKTTNRKISSKQMPERRNSHSSHPHSPPTKNEYGSIRQKVIVGVIVVLSLFLAYMFKSNTPKSASKAHVRCENFTQLQKIFTTVEESLWYSLQTNVRRATSSDSPREPGTILFLHYGTTAKLDNFLARVTNITAGCFGGMEPILLTGNHFKRSDIQQDYGVFLVQQKEALRQRGVMVVRNLEDVPGSAAQAFHTICDTEEPLVDSAIIYLALDMFKLAGVTEPSDESAAKEAERALNMLWKNSLRPQILLPLITRLTETVHWIV